MRAKGWAPATTVLLWFTQALLSSPVDSVVVRKLPDIINLSKFAAVSANGTCGGSGYEYYCKLPERDPAAGFLPTAMQPKRTCSVCLRRGAVDASMAGNATLLRLLMAAHDSHHDAGNLVDGLPSTWWQSGSLASGWEQQRINITIDLGQVFEISYVSLQSGPSPRPGNWILESSRDGKVYIPWRYFAISDSECWTTYRKFAVLERLRQRDASEAFCTSEYSRLDPLENGMVHIRLNSSREKESTHARYIRILLQKINMYNSDRMYYAINGKLDEQTAKMYYYTIREVAVGGRCICNGYASRCLWSSSEKRLRCSCEGNTCGENCDTCCPLFNQRAWIPAASVTSSSVLASCEECNCHGHSQRCLYNSTVESLQLSLNKQGKYLGGGVCIDCQKHTTGINCERCKKGFYRPRGMIPSDAHPCWPCRCHPNGTSAPCVASDQESPMEPGTCICKPGYSGKLCDTCADGYTGFPSCEICPCTRQLSTYNRSRSCIARDRMRNNLTGIDLNTARECGCLADEDGGSALHLCDDSFLHCDQLSGQCKPCEEGSTGPECDQCLPGYYRHNVTSTNDARCLPCACPTVEATKNAQIACQATLDGYKCNKCPVGHAGQHCERCEFNFYREFTGSASHLCKPCNCSVGTAVSPDASCEENTGRCLRCPNGTTGHSCEECMAGFHGSVTEGGCIPCACDQHGANDNFCDRLTGHCQCKHNFTGKQCSDCISGMMKVSGVCKPCVCHPEGSESLDCDRATGQCSCKHGVEGTACDRCAAGYFNLTATGCSACKPCERPWEVCNSDNGSCSCPYGTEGPRCEYCKSASWRQSKLDSHCQECECDMRGSSTNNCQPEGGQCECKMGYTGRACNQCAFGYYGFPNCSRCECHIAGTERRTCNATSGVCACSDHSGSCLCKANVEGSRCDRCASGTFGLHAAKVDGCTECFCFGRSHKCGQMPARLELVANWNNSKRFLQSTSLGRPWVECPSVYPPVALPKEFLDKLASCYGGTLTLLVALEVEEREQDEAWRSSCPTAIFVGASAFRFTYRHPMHNVALHNGNYNLSIPLVEYAWAGPPNVSESLLRKAFMVGLHRLQSFELMIPLQHAKLQSARLECPVHDDSIANASAVIGNLDINDQANSTGSFEATTIELCECPTGYLGTACENIAAGYFTLIPKSMQEHTGENRTLLEQHLLHWLHRDAAMVLGVSTQCECSNRSQTCHFDSSTCKGCRDHAGWSKCKTCTSNSHNNATTGTFNDCMACVCSSLSPKINCQPGFYGNPMEDGSCQACLCEKTGSMHGTCDIRTGQCVCLPGYTGRRCERCSSRHFSASGNCQVCNSSCVTELILGVAELSGFIDAAHNTLPPHFSLPIFIKKAEHVEDSLAKLLDHVSNVIKLFTRGEQDLIPLIRHAEAEAKKLLVSSYPTTLLINELNTIFIEANQAADAVTEVIVYISSKISTVTGTSTNSDLSPEIASATTSAFDVLRRNGLSIESALKSAKNELQAAMEAKRKVLPSLKPANSLTNLLATLHREIGDLLTILHHVNVERTRTVMLLGLQRNQLDQLKAKHNHTQVMDALVSSNFQSAEDRNRKALHLLDEASAALQECSTSCSSRVKSSIDLINDYYAHQLNKSRLAMEKAQRANSSAGRQKELLHEQNRTMGDILLSSQRALRALRAYEDITATIGRSYATADATLFLLQDIRDKISSFKTSLADTLLEIALSSNRGSAVLQDNRGLSRQLDTQRNSFSAVAMLLNRDVSNINDTRGYLVQIQEMNIKVLETLARYQLQFETDEWLVNQERILYEKYKNQAEGSKNFSVPSLIEQEASLNASKQTIRDIVNMENQLRNQSMSAFNVSSTTLMRDIQRLKEIIQQTRKRVSNMTFSLTGQGQCFRSYQHVSVLDGANFSISVSIAKSEEMDSPDMLLAFLHHPLYYTYYALELRNNSVRFSWRIADHVEEVHHPWVLCASERTWFGIKAARVGTEGVVEVTNYTSGLSRSVSSQSRSAGILSGLIRSSELYVGGVYNQDSQHTQLKVQLPPDVTREMLNGTLDELVVNGQPVGLANFKWAGLACSNSPPRLVEVSESTTSATVATAAELKRLHSTAAAEYISDNDLTASSFNSSATNEPASLYSSVLTVTTNHPNLESESEEHVTATNRISDDSHTTTEFLATAGISFNHFLSTASDSLGLPDTDSSSQEINDSELIMKVSSELVSRSPSSPDLSVMSEGTVSLAKSSILSITEADSGIHGSHAPSIAYSNDGSSNHDAEIRTDFDAPKEFTLSASVVAERSDFATLGDRQSAVQVPDVLRNYDGEIAFLDGKASVLIADYSASHSETSIISEAAVPYTSSASDSPAIAAVSDIFSSTATIIEKSEVLSAWVPSTSVSTNDAVTGEPTGFASTASTALPAEIISTVPLVYLSQGLGMPDAEGNLTELQFQSEVTLSHQTSTETPVPLANTVDRIEVTAVPFDLAETTSHRYNINAEVLVKDLSITAINITGTAIVNITMTNDSLNLTLPQTSVSDTTMVGTPTDGTLSETDLTRTVMSIREGLPGSHIKMRTSYQSTNELLESESVLGSDNAFTDHTDEILEATDQRSSLSPVFFTVPATNVLVRPAKQGAGKMNSCHGNWTYMTEPSAATFGSFSSSSAEIHVPPVDVNLRSLDISLSYRTYDENGTLIYLSSHSNKAVSYIVLQLQRGIVELTYVIQGQKQAKINAGRRPKHDGKWHKAVLRSEASGTRILLSVHDEMGRRWNTSVSDEFLVNSPVSFGGIRPGKGLSLSYATPPFRGCLANITIKNRVYEPTKSAFLSPHKWTGVHPCFTRVEPGLFMDGKSFAIYRQKFVIKRHFSMRFSMKTTSATGLLMSTSSLTRGIALQMSRGRLLLSWNLGKNATGELAIPTQLDSTSLCNKRWHSVNVSFNDATIVLQVNGESLSRQIDSSNLRIRGSLILGGFPDSKKENAVAAVARSSYSGCLRDVRINSEPVSWYSIQAKNRVFLSGCPLST